MKESELYPALKQFLESLGYEVKGEIQDCDVLAVRGEEEPVIVELKLTLNLDVILQSVDRLAVSDKVYIGVPAKRKSSKKRRRQVLKLLRMLGLGLLEIDPSLATGSVNVTLDPGGYQPRKSRQRRERLLGEFLQRVGDPNQGGSDRRRGIMTAYRQRALAIASHLSEHGPGKAAAISDALAEPRARDILYRNVYGWFERIDRGIYQISPRGEEELVLWLDN